MQNDAKEIKSKLNYLNGENARPAGNVSIGGIPVAGIKVMDRTTEVKGTLFVKEGLIFAPLNHEKIEFRNLKDKKILDFMTESGGHFRFSSKIKNGHYKLVVLSKKYQGSLKFEVKDYEVENLKVVVQKIK